MLTGIQAIMHRTAQDRFGRFRVGEGNKRCAFAEMALQFLL
jgi:hypothetical protein